ncbi:hypothetical protein ACIOVF_23975 [Pseudomonas sp. NPDC087612]|uniref:hypothetical protein n=1 Tax=Pseudomonas sp. NPDC087612 TaxID=3364441 RepID=UPI00382BD2B2
MPPAPEIDPVTDQLLDAYNAISRSRQYVGMMAAPAPITAGMVSEYLALHPSAIDRAELEAAVFALDEEFRTNWAEHSSND